MADLAVGWGVIVLLILVVVEALWRLHPAGAITFIRTRSFRIFRTVLLWVVGLSIVIAVVLALIFTGIAIVQDIGSSSPGGCTSANCP